MHNETHTDIERALRSWKGRWLLDGFENRLGMVVDVFLEEDIILLQTNFEGGEKRKISTQPRDDGEFVHPESVRARYRLLEESQVRALLQKRKS